MRSVAGAALRRGLPVSGSGVQAMSRRSSSSVSSPFIGSSISPDGHQLAWSSAQATWREPWPWQVSQPTLTSAQVLCEAVRCGIVVLGDAGRVALGAHVVPVLVQLGPVQLVVGADRLVRVEVEPALAARGLGAAVPGDRQRLQASVGELDQVLLQRLDPEGVFHLEGGEPAIRPVRLDQEPVAVAEEARPHAEMVEGCAGEVAEHRSLGRVVHRHSVLRAGPRLELGRVAAGAGLAADIDRGRRGACSRRLTAGSEDSKARARKHAEQRDAASGEPGGMAVHRARRRPVVLCSSEFGSSFAWSAEGSHAKAIAQFQRFASLAFAGTAPGHASIGGRLHPRHRDRWRGPDE